MPANRSVVATGFEELDRALARLEPAVQRKYGRRALNESLKIVEEEFRRLVPVDTGAMRDAIVRRTPKGRRGVLRRSLMITRKSLVNARRKAAIKSLRHHTKQQTSDALRELRADRGIMPRAEQTMRRAEIRTQGRMAVKQGITAVTERITDGDAFYPAFVELGTSNRPGQSPMRRALYDQSEQIEKQFVLHLRQLVANGGK